MKFLGLWKPESSMGTIADIMKLQKEQQDALADLNKQALRNNHPAIDKRALREAVGGIQDPRYGSNSCFC
jgi:hypothetical protein